MRSHHGQIDKVIMANSESLAHDGVSVDYAILHRPAILIAIATVLFLLQFILAVSILDIVAPYNLRGMWITIPDFPDRLNDTTSMLERVFSRLNGWDGHWYHHIASNGYQCSTVPEGNNFYQCNVAFFPLLSMLVAGLGWLGIDLLYALPLVSQLALLAMPCRCRSSGSRPRVSSHWLCSGWSTCSFIFKWKCFTPSNSDTGLADIRSGRLLCRPGIVAIVRDLQFFNAAGFR